MTTYADRPAVMAIGDSLYQGVRSLTFNADLARFSPPAQVAAALGLPMTLPNPRIPIAFDLEQLFRQGGVIHLLEDIRRACLKNMEFWLSGEAWSQHEAFDNVAIGAAAIADLYTETDAQHSGRISTLVDRMRHSPNADPATIGELWYSLNTCFTLNPQRRPAQKDKTQVQQAADRKPKLLLVNIGSNEGLFRAAFTGSFDKATLDSVAQIPGKMDLLAAELARLPADVEQIVFNSLVRPRTASNLMPARNQPGAPRDPGYPDDGYYAGYWPSIGPNIVINGRVLKDFDDLVAGVNAQVKSRLAAKLGSRFVPVDLYAATTQFDGKHYAERYLQVTPDGQFHRLRNTALNTVLGSLVTGGLTGLDNMHPTVPGYGVIAKTVLAAMGKTAAIDFDQAYRNDSLLRNLPIGWSVSQLELSLLGSLGVFSNFSTVPATATVPVA
jgi:hypothetical protein